jgi:hypothetical protein
VPTNTPTPTPIPTPTPAPTPAILFVGSTSTGARYATQTAPAGIETGDLMIAYYSYYETANIIAPSGWALLTAATAPTGGSEIAVWTHTASLPADQAGTTYTWTFTGTAYAAGGIVAYRGPGLTIDAFKTDSGTSTTPTLNTFNTNDSGDTELGLFSLDAVGFTLPADLTSRGVTQFSYAVNYGAAAGDKPLSAAGTVPADSGTMNSEGWATLAIAIAP